MASPWGMIWDGVPLGFEKSGKPISYNATADRSGNAPTLVIGPQGSFKTVGLIATTLLCARAVPWRQALCPGERPGAGHFANSEGLRPRNHSSLFFSPGQSPISRRFAGAKSHFGAFRRGERSAQGRCPGARHFALANALAHCTLPIRRRSALAITRLFSFRPGNHPFRDDSPGQILISGRFAGASAMRKGGALAPGTLPW
jgi:hypothetical protein